MPTVFSHALLGYAAAQAATARRAPPRDLALAAALLPVLPDADVLFMRWIPYEHPFGHRGCSHSLFFAAVVGALGALLVRPARETLGGRRWAAALFLFAVVASHGVLDALTDGGLGIEFFFPFDATRYFLPWAPIPVAPLNPGWFFSGRMFTDRDFWRELLLLWPVAAAPIAWRRLPGWGGRLAAGLCAALGVAAWAWACSERWGG
ncbi:MAG: metal-dependent hydrolase [Planctomycetes bacterium]|nr:metal-dependent hydrolase [Planctomycetota bacterium]